MATIKREGNKIYVLIADRMRLIGEIIGGMMAEESGGEAKDSVVLSIDRNRETHLMVTSGTYGFAKEVMDHKDWFDFVLLYETSKEGNFTYLIPREDIILHGRDMETGGFERQYFVKLETLKKYRI